MAVLMAVVYTVYRRSKATRKVSSQGDYRSEDRAKERVKENRKHQKEYTWTVRKRYI